MRKELRNRLATEYRRAATLMGQAKDPAKILFYFSVFFGETQRVLNWEWDKDLALIHLVTRQVHTQINPTTQSSILAILPVDGATIYEKLISLAHELATYFEKVEVEENRVELYQILGHFAELAYVVSGNGSYLYEKGLITL